MPTKRKLLILVPDGVGLRNFVFSDFQEIAKANQMKLTYWNGTSFDLDQFNLEHVPLVGRAHFRTDLMKRARKDIEIKHFTKRFNNTIYKSYLFKSTKKDIQSRVKDICVKSLKLRYKNNLLGLREKIKQSERKTSYYKNCLAQLNKEQPELVFCTNQRPLQAISPILSAQDLGIPTATFIFSWDNLPKATMVIETDYYLVWSEFMAKQLKTYYPYIDKDKILVTGSPQFEMHFKKEYHLDKSTFCNTHGIPEDKQFICFSGDDITTSPHDPDYLNDLCEAVLELNLKGDNLAIIFRQCPVDLSDRYDTVLKKHKGIVYPLKPLWKQHDNKWDCISPTLEDQKLLYNTIAHSELIINIGSSMVFDAACHNKACAYINYNPNVNKLKKNIYKIYKYIHFESMTSKDCVVWINSKEEIGHKITEGIKQKKMYTEEAKKWMNLICKPEIPMACKRIVDGLNFIIDK